MLTKENLSLSRKTTTIFFTVAGLTIGLLALWYLKDLVLTVIAAYLLMLALQKPIRQIIKWTRLPKVMTVIISYILFLILSVAAAALVLPALISKLANLLKQVNVNSLAPGLAEEITNFNYNLREWSEIFGRFASSFGTIFKLIGGTFGILFKGITLFVISIHLSLEHNDFYKKVYWFTNNEEKVVKLQKFILLMEKDLGGWIYGQSILMLVMGVLVGVGLYLIGVPYALPLGILAGTLEIVPNIGPIIAAIPAIILAMIYGGWQMTLWTTLFSIMIQQLENILIVPTVMRNAANVSPIISILLIIAGYNFFGVIGALLAVPIYIAIRTTYGFWFKDKIRENQN